MRLQNINLVWATKNEQGEAAHFNSYYNASKKLRNCKTFRFNSYLKHETSSECTIEKYYVDP